MPKCVKDVQRLTTRLAALIRFISRSEKSHLYFNTLRKVNNFNWTPQCEEALQQLKTYLMTPPLLSKSVKGDLLYIYLAVSTNSLSAVLVQEDQGKQHPVYYVNRAMLDAETRYTQLEKLALALVMAGRKLRPYFQAHSIAVVTSFPLKTILHKPNIFGRLSKCAVELGEYDITYQPRTTIKSQVLADFIVDFSHNEHMHAEKQLLCISQVGNALCWGLEVDGLANNKGSGLGIVLISLEGERIVRAIWCGFKMTNNEAEYEALVDGMLLVKDMHIRHIKVKTDSQLIANQVSREFQAKYSKTATNLDLVTTLKQGFESFELSHISREDNVHADALANLGSVVESNAQWPAIWKKPPNLNDINASDNVDCWMTPITEYLCSDKLPEYKVEAKRIKIKAAIYSLLDGELYKRSFFGPYFLCENSGEVKNILPSCTKENAETTQGQEA